MVNIKVILIFGGLLSLITFSNALEEPGDPIPLWPADSSAPGDESLTLPEEQLELKGNHKIEIITNVAKPTLVWYPAPAKNNSGPSVLVCPGGGYNVLAYSHEGKEVCDWLNSIGVNAGLLKYRVPRRKDVPKHQAPLQDVQRAIEIIRSKSEAWKINPKRVGILGFSAGGHLSTMALTSRDKPAVAPDFAVLVYPAYLKNPENENQLSPEIVVSENTPPAFVVVAHGDKKFVEGAALFYLAMRRKNRDCELHIYGKGGHGFGFKNTEEEIKKWPSLAENWMRTMGLLKID